MYKHHIYDSRFIVKNTRTHTQPQSWEPSTKSLLGMHAQHAAVLAASVAENSAAPAAGVGAGAGGSAGAGINASVFNRNVQLHQQNAVQQV